MGEGVNLFPWHPALVRVQGSCAIIYEVQFRNAGLGIKKKRNAEGGARRRKMDDGRRLRPGYLGPVRVCIPKPLRCNPHMLCGLQRRGVGRGSEKRWAVVGVPGARNIAPARSKSRELLVLSVYMVRNEYLLPSPPLPPPLFRRGIMLESRFGEPNVSVRSREAACARTMIHE